MHNKLNQIIYILFLLFIIMFSLAFADQIKQPFLVLGNKGVANDPTISDTDKTFTLTEKIVIDEQEAVINVVKNANPAVVSIIQESTSLSTASQTNLLEASVGTGFIIDGESGIVLTNRHVVNEPNAEYKIMLGGTTEEIRVSDVYLDPLNDFAILQLSEDYVSNRGESLPIVELGDSSNLQPGQTVVAIGNALGDFANSVTKGVVSGIGREIYTSDSFFGEREFVENVIQTDAALNPGNSGGPLLDLESKVIGINVAIANGSDNIGFSIPINDLKPVIEQFKSKGTIIQPFLGVQYQTVTPSVADFRSLSPGALITSVVPGSPAEEAGLRAGDIVISINGINIEEGVNNLGNLILRSTIDEDTDLVISRSGRLISISVRLVNSNSIN